MSRVTIYDSKAPQIPANCVEYPKKGTLSFLRAAAPFLLATAFSLRAMARTIRPDANLTHKERAAARERTKRKIAALRRASRVLSSQEARALPSAKRGRTRAPSETEEDMSDSETEEDESAPATRPAPPAASGYAKGEHRRSPAAAAAEQEEEADGWADEARGIFRAHEGRRALVDGSARTCGQDGLVTIATALGIATSKEAVRAATLPSDGDTKVGTIKAFAESTLGIRMRSLKNHCVLGYSLWERPGGVEHNMLLLEEGSYYVELKLTMPKEPGTVTAKVDRHVVVYDASFRRVEGERYFCGVFKDNYGAAKLLEASDRAWLGKPHAPAARAVFRSIFPAAAKVEVDNAWLCDRV